jgi:hypothetical protein
MIEIETWGVEYLHARIAAFAFQGNPHPAILDVGAGKGKYHPLLRGAASLTMIDAWAPYLEERLLTLEGIPIVPILGTAERILPVLRASYDVALAIDFIEHLEKDRALSVIEYACRLAPRIAIFTPSGFFPQTRDGEGLGADHWQTHRSAWAPEELEALGFEVEVWKKFHKQNTGRSPDAETEDAIWATWRNA